MADIKKIKQELLEAFNTKAPPPELVAKDDLLDNMLAQYFTKQSHMPKEMRFEGILSSLKQNTDKEVKRETVKAILDRHK